MPGRGWCLIIRKQDEWDTNALSIPLVIDIGEYDTGFIQGTLRQAPSSDSLTLLAEVSVDGEGWVDCSASGFLAPPSIVIDNGTSYFRSAFFNGYKITPYRYFRVRQQAATTNAGRILVTIGAIKQARPSKQFYSERFEWWDTIATNTSAWVPITDNDTAGYQVSPLAGPTWSGTLTVTPEVTFDGEGWCKPYLVTDRTSSGVVDMTYTGTSEISSHVNVAGAKALRVRASGTAPTGSALVTVFTYTSLYGPALEAAAKGV